MSSPRATGAATPHIIDIAPTVVMPMLTFARRARAVVATAGMNLPPAHRIQTNQRPKEPALFPGV
jgi:hypothetical protein